MLQPVTISPSPDDRIGIIAIFLLQNFIITQFLGAFPFAIAQSPIKPEQCNLTRSVVENPKKSVENFPEHCGKVVESLGKNCWKDKNFKDYGGVALKGGEGFTVSDDYRLEEGDRRDSIPILCRSCRICQDKGIEFLKQVTHKAKQCKQN